MTTRRKFLTALAALIPGVAVAAVLRPKADIRAIGVPVEPGGDFPVSGSQPAVYWTDKQLMTSGAETKALYYKGARIYWDPK